MDRLSTDFSVVAQQLLGIEALSINSHLVLYDEVKAVPVESLGIYLKACASPTSKPDAKAKATNTYLRKKPVSDAFKP